VLPAYTPAPSRRNTPPRAQAAPLKGRWTTRRRAFADFARSLVIDAAISRAGPRAALIARARLRAHLRRKTADASRSIGPLVQRSWDANPGKDKPPPPPPSPAPTRLAPRPSCRFAAGDGDKELRRGSSIPRLGGRCFHSAGFQRASVVEKQSLCCWAASARQCAEREAPLGRRVRVTGLSIKRWGEQQESCRVPEWAARQVVRLRSRRPHSRAAPGTPPSYRVWPRCARTRGRRAGRSRCSLNDGELDIARGVRNPTALCVERRSAKGAWDATRARCNRASTRCCEDAQACLAGPGG